MIRWARRALGVLLLAAAARWAWRSLVMQLHATRPLYGSGLDVDGRLVRLRILPLTTAELQVARELERDLAAGLPHLAAALTADELEA